jgi:DNA-binding ferritin-like protein
MKPFTKYREELKEQALPVQVVQIAVEEPAIQVGTRCADDIMRSLVQYQVQVRVLHWATESFAQHKASDDTYESVGEILDTLVEAYQGYCGRIRLGGQLNILNYDNLNIEHMNCAAMQDLEDLRGLVSDYSDVCNIIDELIGAISKFKYLLTLR